MYTSISAGNVYTLQANSQHMATREEIAALLKSRRKELGLSQSAVADAVGVADNSYRAWEYGDSLPTRRNNLAALAKVLQVPVQQLMLDAGDEEGSEARVVRTDDPYPSRVAFLEENDGLERHEIEHLIGLKFKSGDPGADFWAKALVRYHQDERAIAKRQGENLADASKQPGGLPLKRKR